MSVCGKCGQALPAKPFDYEGAKAKTVEAFAAPRVGDRFHETYSFWMYVLHADAESVITMESGAPCTFPDDGKLKTATPDAWRARFGYKSHDGYSVLLADRDNDVSGWLAEALRKGGAPAEPSDAPMEPPSDLGSAPDEAQPKDGE